MVKGSSSKPSAWAVAGLRAVWAALVACGRGVAAVARYLWTRPRRTKLKGAAAAAAVVVLVLTPFDKGDAGVVLLPTDGTEITLPHTLLEGKLYKLIVSGTYVGASDGRRYDAEYVTESDPFDTPRSSLVIDDRLATSDFRDEANHRYTYYVAGRGRAVRLRLTDRLTAGGPEGGYFDNEGFLEVALEEADFRFYADDDPGRQSPAIVFRYSLEPPPRPGDVVRMEVFARKPGGGREQVFDAASDGYVDPAAGFPLRLGTAPVNKFTWYGIANKGARAYQPLPPGLYDARLSVRAGDDVFYAFPPNVKSEFLTVAVLPASSDPRYNPRPVIAQDDRGRNAFPYYSPRATHPILGPLEGVENIYALGEEYDEPAFLYYSPEGADGAAVASGAVFYVKRAVNLALATLAECDPAYEYTPLRNISGVYGDELVAKLVELRERLPYDTSGEERILDDVDNLPPAGGYAPTDEELGRILGRPTLEHLLNLKFAIRGFPTELPLREFDNYKAYDESDPYHSLYHTFWEVGGRVNAERRRYSSPPASGAPTPGKKYDPSDADLVALLMAISYQECGFVHTLSDGICYRVGRGRGSATGYMQCTADLIKGTNYKITFPTADGLVATRINRLPYNSRYAVRNVARFNVEIGAQFLREVVDQANSASFGKTFARATTGDGVLSWASAEGRVNRVKLAGAMYNAGPGAMRVIITEVYDDPATPGRNEGVDYFVEDCEGDLGPFLARFRKDLYEYSRGRKRFPLQKKGAAGTERLQRLIRWLGPFWHKKYEGISWEEAALIKLDREVIPYVDGLATNFINFRKNDAYYFKARNFYGLWRRPERVPSIADVIRPARGIRRRP
ncbi:MAG: hypothetical protein V3W11_07950 [bacterium]